MISPSRSVRSSTSTTNPSRDARLRGTGSNRPVRRWSPISNRSGKPAVTKRTGREPACSSRALVQRVVAKRIRHGTLPGSTPLRARMRRIPSTGASSPERSSRGPLGSTPSGTDWSRTSLPVAGFHAVTRPVNSGERGRMT